MARGQGRGVGMKNTGAATEGEVREKGGGYGLKLYRGSSSARGPGEVGRIWLENYGTGAATVREVREEGGGDMS